MASSEKQKQKIKEHLARSMGKFSLSSSTSMGLTNSEERKRQIINHIQLTKG